MAITLNGESVTSPVDIPINKSSSSGLELYVDFTKGDTDLSMKYLLKPSAGSDYFYIEKESNADLEDTQTATKKFIATVPITPYTEEVRVEIASEGSSTIAITSFVTGT